MANQTIGLNPKYSLSNFVVGLTNNLAFAAAQAVAQNPGTTYNPLFIYGPSGVGKTHLMHAIGNTITAKDPRAKLVYVTSERFMNDFVDSIQNKKTNEFRSRYRNCSLLLIDDIQFIAGKDSTQEEFFHTFNELSTKNAQIVLTSDRPPNDMQKLETRLMSRFQGGLMVDIQLPDFDTRMAILRAKLSERGDTLPEEVLQLIAENITSNTRELEGKLISILSLLKLTNQPPTLEFIRAQIGKSTNAPGQTIDQKQVMTLIHRYFNIKPQDLTGPRRQKELVMPRQIAMYLLYEDCHLPFEKVGSLLGGRDHTTILHGVEKIKVAIDRDREIARIILDLRQQLTN
jgi:chromosomal replication initiator protein